MLGDGSYLDMYINVRKYLYNVFFSFKRGLRITARRYTGDDDDDDNNDLEYDKDGKLMARGDDEG